MACSATTIRARRDEWIAAGIFARLKPIALETYNRIVGLVLELATDECITLAPGGGECTGRSPTGRRKQSMKRSSMFDGYGFPLDRVLAPPSRHDSRRYPGTSSRSWGQQAPATESSSWMASTEHRLHP